MYHIIFTRISTTFFSKIFRSTVDCWLLYISRRKQAQHILNYAEIIMRETWTNVASTFDCHKLDRDDKK